MKKNPKINPKQIRGLKALILKTDKSIYDGIEMANPFWDNKPKIKPVKAWGILFHLAQMRAMMSWYRGNTIALKCFLAKTVLSMWRRGYEHGCVNNK